MEGAIEAAIGGASLFQSKNEPEGTVLGGQLQTAPFRDFFIYVS
jgi:hypothetical protein